MPEKNRWLRMLDVAATIAIIVAASAVTWSVVNTQNVGRAAVGPTMPPDLVEDLTARRLTMALNDKTAAVQSSPKIALIEFTDFECQFCSRYALDTLPRLKAEFVEPKKIAYTVKNFPIDALHPHARAAAGAAICAQKEGKFWEMHGWLFANQGALLPDVVKAQARELELDERCFETVNADVSREVAEGTRLSVNSMPTFFLGTLGSDGVVSLRRKIRGAVPYDVFKTEITKLLGSSK